MDKTTHIKHTFAVCAYKDSPYLEACLRSLKGQRVKTDIILCTSTPSPYIEKLAYKYEIPVYVRNGDSDIQDDWNFAYQKAAGELVTIAHQDDMYHKDYAAVLLEQYAAYPDMTVFASDYITVKNGRCLHKDPVEVIKKLMRLSLRVKRLAHVKWVKESVLRFGNSICCPSCSYNKGRLGDGKLFESEFKFALDWETMYRLAGRPGRFICAERPLLYYRVHESATTKQCIADNRRRNDEIAMFRQLWPDPVVKVLMHFYKKAYKAYD